MMTEYAKGYQTGAIDARAGRKVAYIYRKSPYGYIQGYLRGYDCERLIMSFGH